MRRALLAVMLGAVLAPSFAAAQPPQRRMQFQLRGSAGDDLSVTIEYLDPSVVDPRLGGSRALPVSLTVRNTSSRSVRFDLDGVRLLLDGAQTLRPIAPESIAGEVRRMKQVPGLLRALAAQSSAFHPGAIESTLRRVQLRGGALEPGESRSGLLYFVQPPAFSADTSSGVVLLDVDGHQPQLLATRKVGVETKAPDQQGFTARLWQLWTTYLSPNPPSFNKSYALVVGIGKYQHLPQLSSPARDVEKVRAYLDAQGFDEVVTLLDDQVTIGAFRHPQLYLKNKLQPNDRFLFYYSGHGMVDTPGKRGYLPLADEVEDDRHAKSIAMLDLVTWLRGLATQHLLVVLDSCFSGFAVDGVELKNGSIRAPDPKVDAEALNRMSRGPARYMLMAGTAGQESVGGDRWRGSLFTEELLTGLRRDADLYQDHIVTARELYVWLRPAVEREARRVNRELTPMFMDLGPGASRGEFVFVQ